MRLIDADKLIEEGYVLVKHGESNRMTEKRSIADVPSVEFDEEHEEVKKKICKVIVWSFFTFIMTFSVSFGYFFEKQITLHIMTAICVGLLGNMFYDVTRWLFKEDEEEEKDG